MYFMYNNFRTNLLLAENLFEEHKWGYKKLGWLN